MSLHRKWLTALLIMLLLTACGVGGGDDDDDHDDDDHDDGPGVSEVTGSHRVLAFNDLGMHCADLDYSTFVILPPFNVIHAQIIERGATPRILDASSVNVNYRASTDGSGSINSTSQNLAGSVNKTNFWDTNPASGNSFVNDLFGLDPPADEGLLFGQSMPGILNPYTANDAQAFNHYDPLKKWFAADGVPIVPIDDAGQLNAYPLMRVSATEPGSADPLASLDVVLPVASEADCQNCHAAGEVAAPIDSSIDFVLPEDINDANSVLQAAKQNILLLHDAEHGTDLINATPVLCAGCHYSAALDLTGSGPTGQQLNMDTMSEVMHDHHGQLTDPDTDQPLFPTNGSLEETCYQCHPGKITQCLRGAMGAAGIGCQDCHGSMLAVGSDERQPWLDEPRCESCHTGDAVSHLGNNLRLTQAWEDDIDTATPRVASNKRFAENSDTLYRNSLGHGGVACEGCHGSTHAIWPNPVATANDNLAAIQLQGHAGTLSECSSCHTSLPLTLDGPHGMHNVNSRGWNLEHEDFYEDNPQACMSCHGQNLEGTVLSMTAADRTFLRDDDGQLTRFVAKGTAVSCTLCHERPD
ncbi:MAG: cytochrome C [gamma proteobacterium symbiont of Ctena orbiculata]|nr:MAG: cytochrome C [gamma proteobacterium symbiont of Ctena orbiculata]